MLGSVLHLYYSNEPVMRLDYQILVKSPPYWLNPPLVGENQNVKTNVHAHACMVCFIIKERLMQF